MFHMLMEPRAFFVIKQSSFPLLFGDLFGAVLPAYVETSTGSGSLGAGRFPWGNDLDLSVYHNLVEEFKDTDKYLSFVDARHVKEMHPPRGNNLDINDYAIAKVYEILEERVWSLIFKKEEEIPQSLVDLREENAV